MIKGLPVQFAWSGVRQITHHWDMALLVTMVAAIIGLLAYQLTPQPQQVITLKPLSPPVRQALLAPSEIAGAAVDVLSAERPRTSSRKPRSAYRSKKPAKPPVLNINTASLQQLQLLPGIGPKMAERVVAYRKTNGPFASVEQVMEVKGIGPKKFEKMKAFLKLN